MAAAEPAGWDQGGSFGKRPGVTKREDQEKSGVRMSRRPGSTWLWPRGGTLEASKEVQVCGRCGLYRNTPAVAVWSFRDKKPEERTRIIEDNRLCPFCLLHDRGEVCYSKVNKRKPACGEAECKGQHIQWLHEVMKGTLQGRKKTEGKVNVIQGREGWRTPKDAWMEEEEEEEEMHFMNVVQAEEVGSDAELEAEIARTEEAIDECFWSRAKRAGIVIEVRA
jgi:hypothetical protein